MFDSTTSAPTGSQSPQATTSATIPEKVGQFRIIGEIGAGGMGAVYRAQQQHPQRVVALKLIKGVSPNPELLKRFEREAFLLAQLQHPGIAQIFEAGIDNGVPFFAMELVPGRVLTDYAKAHALSYRSRLRILTKICDAVQHAHAHGIIHRDLKPDNILVTDDGQPKILDFGIARATNNDLQVSTLHTDVGQILGTLPYMSPEQISGRPEDVDYRTDVYALGVIAYQLLADRLPLDLRGKSIVEAARVIAETEPAPLSSTHSAYRGDVETIIRKALDKDKTRRYQTATELRDDLQRFLDNKPITARAPSAAYQFRKFCKRHTALVAGVAGIILALSAGLAATSIALAQAREAQADAERQAQIASAVNSFLNDDLLAAVAPSVESGKGIDVKMREVLDVAGERIAAASEPGERFDNQPEVEASIRHTLGSTYLALGEFENAEKHLRRSIDLYSNTVGERAIETQSSRVDLAQVYWRQEQVEAATVQLEPAVEVFKLELGTDDPRTLTAMADLASNYKHADRLDEAGTLYDQVLEGQLRVHGADHRETLVTRYNIALLVLRQGETERALEMMQAVVDDRARVLGEGDHQTVNSVSELASLHARQGDFDKAEPLYVRAIAGQRELLGDQHWRTLETLANFATILYRQARFDEAAPIYAEALEGYREQRGETYPDTLVVTALTASTYEKRERHAEAAQILVRAYDELEAEGSQDAEAMGQRACKIVGLLEAAGDSAAIAEWSARCPSES